MKSKDNFDGKPSFELPHRPFFSIVIACYNSGKTLGRLLQSIVDQHMKDDIEVILSDDCSTESYDDVVDAYRDKICIKRVQTKYNCCPGNTRERAIEAVEGEWLMICDHDDMLIADTLKIVKGCIIKYGEQYHAYTNFYQKFDRPGNFEDNVFDRTTTLTGWNHGKFYNMDNLWRKFHIHFIEDMKTHEDIYISSTVNTIMKVLGRGAMHIDIFTYIWHKRPESLSNEILTINGERHQFLEVNFEDYLRSTSGVFKEQYLLKNVDVDYLKYHGTSIIVYSYFYLQSFIFHQGDKLIKENIELCKRDLRELKELTGLTNHDILSIVAKDDARMFMQVFDSARAGAGPTIPAYTFYQWLQFISE